MNFYETFTKTLNKKKRHVQKYVFVECSHYGVLYRNSSICLPYKSLQNWSLSCTGSQALSQNF